MPAFFCLKKHLRAINKKRRVMKKVIISFFVVLVVAFGFLLLPLKFGSKGSDTTYLRIHVRANSNSSEDQAIKYQVKDILVSYLTPLLQDVKTVDGAKVVLENNLDTLSSLATDFLKENGFGYGAKAKMSNEYFPTRSYEDLTLEDGFYDALIVELGSAAGNNWWCVVYPPLCFSEKQDSSGVEYASIIAELIKRREKN